MDKTKDPLISVIISSYNYGHFITETLESLQQQTYKNWECIVMDDGSKDNTEEVVTAFAKKEARVKYFKQVNQGTSFARNNAVKQSTGEFLQFLDADDKLENKKFENELKIFNEHPELDVVYTSVRYFTTEHPEYRKFSMDSSNTPFVVEFTGKSYDMLEQLITQNFIVVNAPLFRKSVKEEVGEFYTPIQMFVEDWDFWLRVAFKNKNFYFDNNESSFCLVRIHEGSSSRNLFKMIAKSIIVRGRVEEQLTSHPDIPNRDHLLNINRDTMISLHIRLANMELGRRGIIEAYKNFFSAIAKKRDLKFTVKTLFGIIFPEGTRRRELILRLK